MNVFDWLRTEIGGGETVLRRFSHLIFNNGGRLVVEHKGKTNLKNLAELLELQGMSGCLDGFLKSNDGKDWEAVRELLEKESARLHSEEEKSVANLVSQTLTPVGTPHN
jgi:hypothetical protein